MTDRPTSSDMSHERLEELDQKIRQAREHAREALAQTDPDEHQFHESGDIGRELDDQTIAPPG